VRWGQAGPATAGAALLQISARVRHLLIDDSEGVWMEGRQFDCRVVHLRPDDPNWVQAVAAEVNKSLASL
jgi:hypothetical protein